jgi:hypothetical protein
MSKKQLQVEGIMNELEGASLYFTNPITTSTPPLAQPPSNPDPERKTPRPIQIKSKPIKILTKEKPATNVNKQAIVHASIDASMTTLNQNDIVETIRKTVKQVGKDTVFIRLTPEEKAELASIVFTFNELYRGNHQKISENVVGRIGLNLLVNDYQENGELSILARVLAALNA